VSGPAGRVPSGRRGRAPAPAWLPSWSGAQGRSAGPGTAARLLGWGGQTARGRRAEHLGATLGAAIDPRVVIDGLDPRVAVEALVACADPYLIGIRHHSPVLANAIPALLEAAAPDLVLLELPEELQPWIEWLGAEELEAPVALAAARRDGRG